jgi:uncharacterized membrane protein YfcA
VSPLECVLVLAAGVFAGAINTIVGSGTLVTFPVLLAVGYGPVVANVSNTLGLVPGSISGAIGYRSELAGQRRRVAVLGAASLLGGIAGAALLLSLPSAAFEAIVPVLIVIALVLVVGQPRLARAVAARRAVARPHGGPLLWVGIFGTGVYGGYFGAAQGVILLAITGIAIPEDLQRLNALKNVLAALVNGVAAVVFVVFASVAWLPALLLAVGSAAGGQLGARIGRRLSPTVLRGVIVVVGVAAIVQLVA